MKHPATRYLGDDLYELLEDYVFEWAEKKKKYRLTIQKGFICDLASVPRIAQTPLGLTPGADMTGPGALHDYLYSCGGKLPGGAFQEYDPEADIWWSVTEPWSRPQADALFLEAMRQSGVRWIPRQLAWSAVRAFGGSRWG